VTDHELHKEDAGAYLLGALEPAEQSAFERHMASCHECRAEVDRLRPAADALPRSVDPYAPPASLKRSLMEAVREDAAQRAPARRPVRERLFGLGRLLTGMRPELAWVSAAFVLMVGVALGFAVTELTSGGGGDGQRVVAAEVDSSRLKHASATLTLPKGKDGPAHLRVVGMPRPKPGRVYEIWLKRGNQLQPGPLFDVDSQGNGVGAIPDNLDGVSAILVTQEHEGGAQTPSQPPIISARI
jgi:anti-sigma factor RsiW